MKNKNRIIFWSAFFLLSSTVFLASPSVSIADEDNLIVSEIMYDPEGTDTGHSDWIEIYNDSTKEITIKKDDFGLIDEKDLELGTDGKHYKNCHGIDKDLAISPGEYAIIAQDKDDFSEDYPDIEKGTVLDSAFSLSSSGDYLHISADKCATFFVEFNFENSWGGKNNGMTLEKIKMDEKYGKDSWQESYVFGGTPGKTNSQKPKPRDYPSKLILNEILPHSATGGEEYIEIYNPGKEDVNIENYILRDESKTGKYVFPENAKIKSEDYLVVYKKDFKFALNDSGEESVSLFDPVEKMVDKMTYNTSKENYSWNFDGSKWRLSHFLTPGKNNVFEKILQGKVEMDEEIYAGMYAAFSTTSDSDAQKFTWDFGDGHKSYLRKTRHKYEVSGTYSANLKITGNGEDSLYNFTVTVEDYDAPNVKIVAVNPNPKGSDTKNETITIQNKSKKKVNLINWSIATGWKNLYNHPIKKDFEIKKGATKILTKKFCAFTLNNLQSKIELRDPTGAVVQKIKYDRKKNKIVEDEVLEINGKKLKWDKPENIGQSETAPKNIDESSTGREQKFLFPTGRTAPSAELNIIPEEIQANLGKYTPNPFWQEKRENQIKFLSYNSPIKTPAMILENRAKVLGISAEKNTLPEKHWAAALFDKLWIKINFSLNWAIAQM